MTMTYLTDLYDKTPDITSLPLFMFMGAGAVDPELVEPHDELESQELEDLIAFRCSTVN